MSILLIKNELLAKINIIKKAVLANSGGGYSGNANNNNERFVEILEYQIFFPSDSPFLLSTISLFYYSTKEFL